MITADASASMNRAFESLMSELPLSLIPVPESPTSSEPECFEAVEALCLPPDPWEAVDPPTIDDFPW